MSYKENNSFKERQNRSNQYKEQHLTKIPIIIERYSKCNLKLLDRPEILIENNSTVAQLQQLLKNKLSKNDQNCSFFFYISNEKKNQVLLNSGEKLQDIANKSKDEDGFLYITYHNQDTLG